MFVKTGLDLTEMRKIKSNAKVILPSLLCDLHKDALLPHSLIVSHPLS